MIGLALVFLAAGIFSLAAFGAIFSVVCYAIGFVLDVVGFVRSREFSIELPEPDPDPGESEPIPGVLVSLDEFRSRRVPRSPPPLDETASA